MSTIIIITPPPPPLKEPSDAEVTQTTAVTIGVPDEGSLAYQLRLAADILDGND